MKEGEEWMGVVVGGQLKGVAVAALVVVVVEGAGSGMCHPHILAALVID